MKKTALILILLQAFFMINETKANSFFLAEKSDSLENEGTRSMIFAEIGIMQGLEIFSSAKANSTTMMPIGANYIKFGKNKPWKNRHNNYVRIACNYAPIIIEEIYEIKKFTSYIDIYVGLGIKRQKVNAEAGIEYYQNLFGFKSMVGGGFRVSQSHSALPFHMKYFYSLHNKAHYIMMGISLNINIIKFPHTKKSFNILNGF